MIAAVVTWSIIGLAGVVAVAVIIATAWPAAGRIWDALRWQEHDQRVGLSRPSPHPQFGRKGVIPRRGPLERFLRDMGAGR